MQKKKLLVSACLLGIPCRYDGLSKPFDADLAALSDRYELIPVCPEIYGGLPTARTPSERVGERVIMKDSTDVTENYKRGAEATLTIAKKLGASVALLKAKSPSCGKYSVYDGSFSGVIIEGQGVTAELLAKYGIEIFDESEIDLLLS